MEPANVDEQYLIEKWDMAANGGNVGDAPYNELRINIENTGELYSMQKSFTLKKKIDQAVLSSADYLEKSGSVSLEFRVCPLYLQSANGSKAGDYYFVTCAVTPHNSTTSYTLNTVNYTLDTSSPTVKYHYYTSNVKVE